MNIERKVKYKNIYWNDVQDPDDEFIKHLGDKYKFHELDLEDLLSEDQRSKIDDYDKYIFIVIHFPIYDKKTKVIKVSEMHLFVGRNYLITLHKGDNKLIEDFMNEYSKIVFRF